MEMKKKVIRLIIIAVFLALATFCGYLAVKLWALRQQLAAELVLETGLQNHLLATKTELDRTKQELDIVNSKLTQALNDNSRLIEEKKSLEMKLSSLKDLREAIRKVKRDISEKRWQEFLGRFKTKEVATVNASKPPVSGNHGFIVKDKRSTYKQQVKIEVREGE